MYFPYFRGKQFELLAIREQASLIVASEFTPIIEPVKDDLGGLQRSVQSVLDEGGGLIVVANPRHGDHADNNQRIEDYADEITEEGATVGIFLDHGTPLNEILRLYGKYRDNGVALIHAGFPEGRELADQLDTAAAQLTHVFFEADCSKLYRRHFANEHRILIRDGFARRKNRDYPDKEVFSDLHVTYKDEGAEGFGDFLMVGNEYRESGGPAYAVAIHLTYIDATKDDEMWIHHFKSDRSATPQDPAGKFAEALRKLVDEVESQDTQVLKTGAVRELLDLHKRRHFPGLGYLKKLSMKHHIETLAGFCGAGE